MHSTNAMHIVMMQDHNGNFIIRGSTDVEHMYIVHENTNGTFHDAKLSINRLR